MDKCRLVEQRMTIWRDLEDKKAEVLKQLIEVSREELQVLRDQLSRRSWNLTVGVAETNQEMTQNLELEVRQPKAAMNDATINFGYETISEIGGRRR